MEELNQSKHTYELFIVYVELSVDLFVFLLCFVSFCVFKKTPRLVIVISVTFLRVLVVFGAGIPSSFLAKYVPFYCALIAPAVDMFYANLLDAESIYRMSCHVRQFFPGISFSTGQIISCLIISAGIAVFLSMYWHEFILQSDFGLITFVQLNCLYFLLYEAYIIFTVRSYQIKSDYAKKALSACYFDETISANIDQSRELQHKLCRHVYWIFTHNVIIHAIFCAAQACFVLAYKQVHVKQFIKYYGSYRAIIMAISAEALFFKPKIQLRKDFSTNA